MSDSSKRRHGTDFDSLRSLGAGSAFSSREEDPLAELARLVSQGESRSSQTGQPRSSQVPQEPRVSFSAPEPRAPEPRAPEPRAAEPRLPEPRLPEFRAPEPRAPEPRTPEPRTTESRAPEPRPAERASPERAPYVPPMFDRVSDRLEPSIFTGDQRPAAPDQRAYGSPAQPDYDPTDDFFADDPPQLRGTQGGYADYPGAQSEDYAAAFQARGAYRDEFDTPEEGVIYPGENEDASEDLPVRRNSKLMMAGAAAGVVLLAGIGAWAFTSSGENESGGAPPVIEAASEPMKTVPEAQPVAQQKEFYDRVDPNGTATVVPSSEEPGEKPAPRVILPGGPAAGQAESGVADGGGSNFDGSPNEGMSEPTGSTDPGSRRVRTIAIRPDGSMASPSEPAPPAQAEPSPQQPPEPIRGSGVAEGMSMQPGSEFGIMSSELPPQQAEPPPPANGGAPEVPMPQPRPQITQSAPAPAAPSPVAQAPQAAAPAPARISGGPPSSPQPQVTITNKRPLQPQGAPPPATRAPGPATQAPSAPRQVAMASPAPGALAPAPQAPRPPAAGPQVATVSGSSSGAFGVQLTAQRSEAEALAAFGALQRRYPQALGSYQPVVTRADLGGDRGVFYRALVPAQSQADASNICIQFKASGIDCVVQRR